MIGIYKITNKINGKVYIGQSVDITTRWKQEINAAKRGEQYPLCRALRKYGIENFEFSILEECAREMLDELECFYIKKFDSVKNGYNLQYGGQTGGKKIDYDEFSNFVRSNPDLNNHEIGERFNINRDTVCRLRKKLGLPAYEPKSKSQLSKIYSLKKEIVELYNQRYSMTIIADQLGLNIEYLIDIISKEWGLEKRSDVLSKSSVRVLVYDKVTGYFIKESNTHDLRKELPNMRFGSLTNERSSDLGLVIRFYKDNYPKKLKIVKESLHNTKWYEFWKEEG